MLVLCNLTWKYFWKSPIWQIQNFAEGVGWVRSWMPSIRWPRQKSGPSRHSQLFRNHSSCAYSLSEAYFSFKWRLSSRLCSSPFSLSHFAPSVVIPFIPITTLWSWLISNIKIGVFSTSLSQLHEYHVKSCHMKYRNMNSYEEYMNILLCPENFLLLISMLLLMTAPFTPFSQKKVREVWCSV